MVAQHNPTRSAPIASALLPAPAPLASRIAQATAHQPASARRPPLGALSPPPKRYRLHGKQLPPTPPFPPPRGRSDVPLAPLPDPPPDDDVVSCCTACHTFVSAQSPSTTPPHGTHKRRRLRYELSSQPCNPNPAACSDSHVCVSPSRRRSLSCMLESNGASTSVDMSNQRALRGRQCNGALTNDNMVAATAASSSCMLFESAQAAWFPRSRPDGESQRADLLRRLRAATAHRVLERDTLSRATRSEPPPEVPSSTPLLLTLRSMGAVVNVPSYRE